MMIDASLVSKSGVYTLVLFVSKEITLTVGCLGMQIFPRGHYTYTGSALGKGSSNLKHRIARHLRKEKRRFWHIDYLLTYQNVSVEAVVVAETNEKMECDINSYIKQMHGVEVPVSGFGASDCKKNCGSHLLYSPEVKKADVLVHELVEHLTSLTGILSVTVLK